MESIDGPPGTGSVTGAGEEGASSGGTNIYSRQVLQSAVKLETHRLVLQGYNLGFPFLMEEQSYISYRNRACALMMVGQLPQSVCRPVRVNLIVGQWASVCPPAFLSPVVVTVRESRGYIAIACYEVQYIPKIWLLQCTIHFYIQSMMRGRLGIRSKYVDVLNPGGVGSAPPPPAPLMMPGVPPQSFSGTFFVPQQSGM